MAKRTIVWTTKANLERKEILNYWIDRNKSKTFSIKLNKLFVSSIKKLSKNPKIGRKTNIKDVRVKLVREYLIFYQFNQIELKVLSIWDGRREESKLNI